MPLTDKLLGDGRVKPGHMRPGLLPGNDGDVSLRDEAFSDGRVYPSLTRPAMTEMYCYVTSRSAICTAFRAAPFRS